MERETALLQMRRETERKILEDKVNIEKQTLEAKALAEGKARAKLERDNEDIHRRQQETELRHLHQRAIEVGMHPRYPPFHPCISCLRP